MPLAPGSPSPVLAAPRPLRHLGADDRSSRRVRIVDATLTCLSTQGLAKTTLDDVAAAAGLSRATVYRAFPGGREAILAAVVETEVARLASEVAVAMGEATDLHSALVAGMVETARRLRAHRAVGFLLAHEPAVLLTHLCFGELQHVLERAADFAAPFLARWLEPEEAARAAEWAARITVSYLTGEGGTVDPTERDDVARLVERFVLPGILALCRSAESDRLGRSAPPATRQRSTNRSAPPTRPEGEPWTPPK